MYVVPLICLGILDKFIIMNVHDATPKKPQKSTLNFSMFSLSWCMKKIHVKNKA